MLKSRYRTQFWNTYVVVSTLSTIFREVFVCGERTRRKSDLLWQALNWEWIEKLTCRLGFHTNQFSLVNPQTGLSLVSGWISPALIGPNHKMPVLILKKEIVIFRAKFNHFLKIIFFPWRQKYGQFFGFKKLFKTLIILLTFLYWLWNKGAKSLAGWCQVAGQSSGDDIILHVYINVKDSFTGKYFDSFQIDYMLEE